MTVDSPLSDAAYQWKQGETLLHTGTSFTPSTEQAGKDIACVALPASTSPWFGEPSAILRVAKAERPYKDAEQKRIDALGFSLRLTDGGSGATNIAYSADGQTWFDFQTASDLSAYTVNAADCPALHLRGGSVKAIEASGKTALSLGGSPFVQTRLDPDDFSSISIQTAINGGALPFLVKSIDMGEVLPITLAETATLAPSVITAQTADGEAYPCLRDGTAIKVARGLRVSVYARSTASTEVRLYAPDATAFRTLGEEAVTLTMPGEYQVQIDTDDKMPIRISDASPPLTSLTFLRNPYQDQWVQMKGQVLEVEGVFLSGQTLAPPLPAGFSLRWLRSKEDADALVTDAAYKLGAEDQGQPLYAEIAKGDNKLYLHYAPPPEGIEVRGDASLRLQLSDKVQTVLVAHYNEAGAMTALYRAVRDPAASPPAGKACFLAPPGAYKPSAARTLLFQLADSQAPFCAKLRLK